MSDARVLAHDVGGFVALPFPLSYALVGSVWVLTLTCVVLALAWRRPRFDPDRPGRPLPRWVTRAVDAPVGRWTAALSVLLFMLWVGVAAVFGPQDGENPLPGVVFVLLWVGLAAASLLVGPVWRVVSPVRTVYRLVAPRRAAGQVPYPAGWGYWPAAVGLFALVWLQLASPNLGTVTSIKVWLVGYLVAMTVGAVVFGPRWFARADPFEVYSVVLSRLSVFRRDAAGRVVVGNPLDHLPSMPVRPGTVAVLAVLLGALAFDSLSALPAVENFGYDVADAVPSAPVFVGAAVRTVGLLLFVVVVGATFWAAARATGALTPLARRQLPGRLAHTLIPVIAGYTVAHNLSNLVERGQETVILLVGPLGWDLGEPHYWLYENPGVHSALKVACVLAGHLVAVVAVRDAGLRLLPPRQVLLGQLALMLTMVGYAFTGLYLLFGG